MKKQSLFSPDVSRNDITRKARNPIVVFFAIFVIMFFLINTISVHGVYPVLKSAIFIANYDNLEKVMTWNEFKTEHKRLNPELSEFRPETVWANVSFNSQLDELLYPKSLTAIHISIRNNGKGSIAIPSILVLVLDQNERIRGKIYSEENSKDHILEPEEEAVRTFWFRFPANMQEATYSVIVEFFGKVHEESRQYGGLSSSQTWEEYDEVYGQIPYWNPSGGGYDWFHPLAYNRAETKSPPTSISWNNILSSAWTASTVLSSVISLLVALFSTSRFAIRLRLRILVEQHPEVKVAVIFFSISLLLFVVFILFIVMFR